MGAAVTAAMGMAVVRLFEPADDFEGRANLVKNPTPATDLHLDAVLGRNGAKEPAKIDLTSFHES